MICCDCIAKIEKLERNQDDYIIVTLNKNITNSQKQLLSSGLDKAFKNRFKIILVPNILNIKIGKYTNLIDLRRCCEHIILECDEAISKRKK